MPDLEFHDRRRRGRRASPPRLRLLSSCAITNAIPRETIHTVALRCQIQIEVTRRRYTAEDQEKLRDLFGEPERWSQTLRNMLWTHVSVNVPPFTAHAGRSAGALHLRFQRGGHQVFSRPGRGEVPLCLMFSGTVFYARRRRRYAGRADLLGERGALPPAGEGLERNDGFVLPEQRLAVPAPRRLRAAVRLQGAARNSDLGSRRWRAAARRKKRCAHESRHSSSRSPKPSSTKDTSVSLPAVVGQEPAALEFRRAVSAGLQRSARRRRTLAACGRVPGSGQCRRRLEVRLRFLQLQTAAHAAIAQTRTPASMSGRKPSNGMSA